MAQRQTQRWQDWLNLILGIWLFFAPMVGVGTAMGIAAWDSYIVGVLVALFSIGALARPQQWEEWINAVLGLWLILAPFVLAFTSETGPMWNHIIVGLVIGGGALWAWFMATTGGQHPHARPT